MTYICNIMTVCKFWQQGCCKFGDACKYEHKENVPSTPVVKKKKRDVSKYDSKSRKELKERKRRPKNTESFQPLSRPVDMRVVMDLGTDTLTTHLTPRDVLLVPNLFCDFAKGDIYSKLEYEIQNCGVPEEELLKLWHGDTHFIADDHTPWKKNAPTFAMVVDRIREFFKMDIKATRFNWYKDTSQWKAFHHDAAAIKEDKAKTQNFTVAVSFGATRDAAFEEVKSKCIISMPQPDGTIYAFTKDTNVLWKHGILKEKEIRQEGRISVICWGWIDEAII